MRSQDARVFGDCVVLEFSIVIMALEQITGLNFRNERLFPGDDEESGCGLQAALYNSTHFEIPHTFDVRIGLWKD